MQDQARAKINLYLHVTGRRADGYHLLDSLAVFADAADGLRATPGHGAAAGATLVIDGPFGAGLRADEQTNLILRAAAAVAGAVSDTERARFASVAMTLEKNLPVASGIGGGSADAAAALRLLRRLWRPSLSDGAWHAIATGLGADVPVCLDGVPTRMRGIGEVLSPGPTLPPCAMVLVNCGESVSTPAVFRARAPVFTPEATLPDRWDDLGSMVADLARLTNDLQDAAVRLCPSIRTVLEALESRPEVRLARMSGSGATCFALCDTVEDARAVAAHLSGMTGWWVWAGGLAEAPRRPAA
nr:4-(cytidine 5'-diphospho)-2-C-methyl-D-erythritol kinase [Ameyamaea chiangmaiensis]